MATTGDEILDQSLNLLRYHYHHEWGDRSPLDVFNRRLAKNIAAPGWKKTDHMDIKPLQIRSHRDKRSTDELSRFHQLHGLDDPHRADCPIIIAVYEGKARLLDGHTRINYWVKQGNIGDHDVNVHVIESE